MQQLVSFDMDGVLADFVTGFTTLANRMFRTPIHGTSTQQTQMDFAGLTSAQTNAVWKEINSSRDFWLNLPALISAADKNAMLALSKKVDILYLTARTGNNPEGQTTGWIKRYGLPQGTVNVSEDKASVLESLPKGRLLASLEDNAKAVAEMQAKGLPAYIRNWPYNAAVKANRVNSVAEFISKINRG